MKKTFFKKLFTASIAAITALSVFRGVPTFADENADATATASGENSVQVAINKTLHIAEGITTPTATFTFTFTEKDGTSSNGAPYQRGVTIPSRSVQYSKTDIPTADKIVKPTENIFDGVIYEHAGEYVYEVKETKSGWNPIKKDGVDIDAMKYDDRSYEMHVLVKNKSNGGTYISSVYFKQIGISNAPKKEPSDKVGSFKYDLFDNTYTKDGGKIDPKDPDPSNPTQVNPLTQSLKILKKVDGNYGDKSKDFNFRFTVKLPSTNATSAKPVTKITVNISGTQEELTVGDDNTTFSKEFSLKHGQDFTISNIPAGSRYTITEVGTKGYTASANYKENGDDKTKADGIQATDFTMSNILIGEKTNDNTITNKFQDVTPTGLLIDNLPFILMIGLGLAGFVVLSKKRREA
ncbi:Spy0128 family protein [Streptococcus sp. ST16]|uniref:DUF7601 domain-containing protein n=1 Tax=Streptococcus sp. ST16 TaxID=3378283 RepID=UPI0038D35E1F